MTSWKATILYNLNEKLGPPQPYFVMEKSLAHFGFSTSSSRPGWFYFLFYSDQDCNLSQFPFTYLCPLLLIAHNMYLSVFLTSCKYVKWCMPHQLDWTITDNQSNCSFCIRYMGHKIWEQFENDCWYSS